MSTLIGLLGDTHGDSTWTIRALSDFHRRGITDVIQVGDFGIYPASGVQFQREVNQVAESLGLSIWVAPGNHEDWPYLLNLPLDADGWHVWGEHIRIAPRNTRKTFGDRVVHFLGGAPSVDRTIRLMWEAEGRGTHWWPEEALTQADVDTAIASGFADILIGHDGPFTPGIDMAIAGNPHGFLAPDLAYALEGRELMEAAYVGIAPRLMVHGHYHIFNSDYRVVEETVDEESGLPLSRVGHVVGLGCNREKNALATLDLETLQVSAIRHPGIQY